MVQYVRSIFFIVVSLVGSAHAFYMDKNDKTPCNKDLCIQGDFDCQKYFTIVPSPLNQETLTTDPILLQQAVRDALGYLRRYWKTHKPIVAAMPFSAQVLSAEKARKTLEFINRIIEEDKSSGKFRILDPQFIEENFGFISWRPGDEHAEKISTGKVHDKKVRLTVYVTYRVKGSYKKTAEFPFPLYRLTSKKNIISRTKQEIFGRILESPAYVGRVKPLVWLSQESVEQAMLQGTILVKMPDGKLRAFNVDQNNGYPFDTQLHNIARQKIYWFFREIQSDQVKTLEKRCRMRKGVVLAGNLYLFGLGKVMALKYKNPRTNQMEMCFATVGDTGSAFRTTKPHLDLFGGIITSKKELQDYLGNFPQKVEAFVMYYKGC